MEPEKAKIVIQRLDDLVKCVQAEKSGADIHLVNNIRHTAQLLKDQLEIDPECIQDELVYQVLKNTEAKVVSLFQKKYPMY